ncbi:Methionine--tRNA ligase [uncultured archaeon]|nr:Methionine--tRNA ligase [uncultured archaeon]
MARIMATQKEVTQSMEEYEFKKAADSVMALADYGNIYFQSHEPWKLVRSDTAKAGAVLRSCLQIAKALVILMEPIMPAKMQAAWQQLGQGGSVGEKSYQEAHIPLACGQVLGRPEILFSRLEEAKVTELEKIFKDRIEQAESREKGKAIEKKKEEISFEHFSALDIRIGEVKEAGHIKGSEKLLKLMVDIGGETRQVVAGIALAYKPEDLVGTQVVVLTNLKPAKLFGIESQAMLLAADVAGNAVLLQPRATVETGTKVR